MQRSEGLLERDCDRLIRNDRVIWGSCMVSCGDADAMVTGNTRRYTSTLDKVKRVAQARKGEIIFGLNVMVNREIRSLSSSEKQIFGRSLIFHHFFILI